MVLSSLPAAAKNFRNEKTPRFRGMRGVCGGGAGIQTLFHHQHYLPENIDDSEHRLRLHPSNVYQNVYVMCTLVWFSNITYSSRKV